jgi:hypothetical protein
MLSKQREASLVVSRYLLVFGCPSQVRSAAEVSDQGDAGEMVTVYSGGIWMGVLIMVLWGVSDWMQR